MKAWNADLSMIAAMREWPRERPADGMLSRMLFAAFDTPKENQRTAVLEIPTGVVQALRMIAKKKMTVRSSPAVMRAFDAYARSARETRDPLRGRAAEYAMRLATLHALSSGKITPPRLTMAGWRWAVSVVEANIAAINRVVMRKFYPEPVRIQIPIGDLPRAIRKACEKGTTHLQLDLDVDTWRGEWSLNNVADLVIGKDGAFESYKSYTTWGDRSPCEAITWPTEDAIRASRKFLAFIETEIDRHIGNGWRRHKPEAA